METSLRHIFKPQDVTAVSQEKDSGFKAEGPPGFDQCSLKLALFSQAKTREDDYHCETNSSDDLSSEMTSESITHTRKFGLMPKSKSGPNLGLL
jgi:hypothetical protein